MLPRTKKNKQGEILRANKNKDSCKGDGPGYGEGNGRGQGKGRKDGKGIRRTEK